MIVPLKSRLLWFQFVAIVSAVLTRPAKAAFGVGRRKDCMCLFPLFYERSPLRIVKTPESPYFL